MLRAFNVPTPSTCRVQYRALNILLSKLPFNVYDEDVNIPLDVMLAFFELSSTASTLDYYIYCACVELSGRFSSPLSRIYNITDYRTKIAKCDYIHKKATDEFIHVISRYPDLDLEPFFKTIQIEISLQKILRKAKIEWWNGDEFADEIIKLYPELIKNDLLE